MKRSFLLLLSVLLVFSLLFTACSQKQEEKVSEKAGQTTVDTQKTQEPANLKMVIWGNNKHQEMYNNLLNDYTKNNPDINFEVIIAPYAEFTEKVTAMIATGAPPDVTWWSEDSLHYFADKGYFQELDEAMAQWGDDWDKSDFYPSTLESAKWKGKQYALPFSSPSNVIYYNKKLFDNANIKYPDENWTWEDFNNAAKKLTGGEGANKVYGADNLLENGTNWQNLLSQIRSYGGKFMNDDRTECIINSPESVKALKDYMELVKGGYVTKPGIEAPFEQNRVGMFTGIQSYNARFDGAKDLEYDIAYMPKGPAGRMVRSGYAGLVIMKTTKYPAQSLDALKFITSKEGIKAQSIYFGPPRKSVGIADDFMSGIKQPANKNIYIESLQYAATTDHFPQFTKANTMVQEEIDKMVAEKQSVEDTLTNIEKRVNELLIVQ